MAPKLHQFDSINKKTWKFFQLARSKNLPISGSVLQETAHFFAQEENIDFKSSQGCLEKFKNRYKIVSNLLNGDYHFFF